MAGNSKGGFASLFSLGKKKSEPSSKPSPKHEGTYTPKNDDDSGDEGYIDPSMVCSTKPPVVFGSKEQRSQAPMHPPPRNASPLSKHKISVS